MTMTCASEHHQHKERHRCEVMCRRHDLVTISAKVSTTRVDNDAVERMLYSCYLFSRRFATCLLVQHLLKSFPTQLWTDVAIQKIYVYIHTHSKNAHHFHVNLYHGIKHDCGKTCVYNSMYIIYIYNFKYTIYLIFFFPYETSMQKHEYGKK